MAKKLFSKKGFISKQKTFQPTIKNESIIDDHQIESHKEFTSDLKKAASIDARIAEFSLVREHSVLEESGIEKGVSILQESGLTRESMWNEVANPAPASRPANQDQSIGQSIGTFKPGQIGAVAGLTGIGTIDVVTGSGSGSNSEFDQQLRNAVAQGKGRAGDGWNWSGFGTGNPIGDLVGCGLGIAGSSAAIAGTAATAGGLGWLATVGLGYTGLTCSRTAIRVGEAISDLFSDDDDSDNCTDPEVDNQIGGTAGPQAVQRLNEAIKNFIDPSSTPGPDGDFATQHPDSLTSPDPTTLRDQYINWGDENTGWGNFPAPEFNPDNIVDPSVNWGDYYTDVGPVVNVGTPVGSNAGCSFCEVNKDSGLELVPIVDSF